MAKWMEEFEWMYGFFMEHDQLPRRVDIARWRGVGQADWPAVLLDRGLVEMNGVGGLRFTELGWKEVERMRRGRK